jgi:hypothetical protein
MAFVPGGFEAANLLLRGLELAGEFRLGKPGLFAQRRDLQGHVPRLARLFETSGKGRVLHLLCQD